MIQENTTIKINSKDAVFEPVVWNAVFGLVIAAARLITSEFFIGKSTYTNRKGIGYYTRNAGTSYFFNCQNCYVFDFTNFDYNQKTLNKR